MKKIDVIAMEESFHNLSTFTDIEDLNKTVRTYRDVIRASVKRADVQARLIALLEVLKRHSCKQIGVSYMCKNTISDMLEVSYKTVQRLMKKLVDLGMIKQIATKRKSTMLQTANAIVIQPVEEEVSDKTTAEMAEKCPTIKTSYSLKTNNLKEIRNGASENEIVDKSVDNIQQANFIAHWVPTEFANLATCFYKDSKTIEEFWRVVRQCNVVVNFVDGTRFMNTNEEISVAIDSLKSLVMKIKSGAKVKNIFGYFNGIVNKLMDKLHYETIDELEEEMGLI